MKAGDVCAWSAHCEKWKSLNVRPGDIAGIVLDVINCDHTTADSKAATRYKILESNGELGDYSMIFLEKVNEKG
jgi:hypothetical protein